MRARPLLLLMAVSAKALIDFDARQVSAGRWRCTSTDIVDPDATLDDLARCQELHVHTLDGAIAASSLTANLTALAEHVNGTGARLRVLDVSGSPLGDDGAVALAPGVRVSSALESFIAYDCRIADEGATALALAIRG